MKLYSLLGNFQQLDGGAMFGNVPKAVWSKWLPCDNQNKIQLACRALLVQLGETTILFETGIGAFFEPKLKERYGVLEDEHILLNSLQKLGLLHTDIDCVVLSHLHFDHAGGLLAAWEPNKTPELLFSKAQYLVSEEAWQRATQPHPRDKASFIPVLNELLEKSQRLQIYNGQESPLGPSFSFHLSEGHTPGLLLSEIKTPEGPLLFGSDLIPGAPWVHLPITMGYDRFPEKLIDEKKALLTYLHSNNGRLFFTHDPHIACAKVTFAEGKFGISDDVTELNANP